MYVHLAATRQDAITKPNVMKKLSFLVLMLFMALSVRANRTLYINFDPSCMDRLEYRLNGKGPAFVTYQYHTGAGIVALEVGIEGKKTFSRLPKATVGCGSSAIDEKLVKSINMHLTDVYVAFPVGDGTFRVSPVGMASFFANDLAHGHIIRPDYEFSYTGDQNNPDQDLATDVSGSKVYYMSEGHDKCDVFHFRAISKQTCRPMTELYLVHGIGIVEERIGATLDEQEKNRYLLTSINGVSPETYRESFCRGERIDLALHSQPKPAAPEAPAPKTVPYEPKRCTGQEQPGFHLVQYGENLFSIARRHSLTVQQLKKWNHLRGDKILACSQLRIEPPMMAQADRPAPGHFKAKGIAKKTAKKFVRKTMPKKSDTGFHIVQKGENLYILARLYGYTVERFAHMNGLKPTDIIKPGMKLKTTDCTCDTATADEKTHAAPDTANVIPMLVGETEKTPEGKLVEAPKLTFHIVEEGETIWAIAEKYGLDVNKLMERNGLEPGEVLIPGQKIYFPGAE